MSHLAGNEWIEHSHSPVFAITSSVGAGERLVSAAPSGDAKPFERLVRVLEPPYYLLYVLHTPRGEGDPGRYQSPELTAQKLGAFMVKYKDYLSADARFDIWAYSPAERATVVWDRHNQIFGYGPLERFASELRMLGFSEGSSEVPSPHQHHYRAEFDPQATALLAELKWSYSPLKPEE